MNGQELRTLGRLVQLQLDNLVRLVHNIQLVTYHLGNLRLTHFLDIKFIIDLKNTGWGCIVLGFVK